MTHKERNGSLAHAIYGVGKLAQLYREFTRESIFTTSRRLRVKPTMGGSFFGGYDRETGLDKKSFRAISSLVCDSDAHIEGRLPIGKLYYFKADNQEYYQTRAAQYFGLVKRYLYDLDKSSTGECLHKCAHSCVWCFFPMVHREHEHLIVGEINAYVMWFQVPSRRKATLYDLRSFQ